MCLVLELCNPMVIYGGSACQVSKRKFRWRPAAGCLPLKITTLFHPTKCLARQPLNRSYFFPTSVPNQVVEQPDVVQ